MVYTIRNHVCKKMTNSTYSTMFNIRIHMHIHFRRKTSRKYCFKYTCSLYFKIITTATRTGYLGASKASISFIVSSSIFLWGTLCMRWTVPLSSPGQTKGAEQTGWEQASLFSMEGQGKGELVSTHSSTCFPDSCLVLFLPYLSFPSKIGLFAHIGQKKKRKREKKGGL